MPPFHRSITVIDFRRQSMILEWNAAGGTWTACDVPPALVHGVALIRASRPNICLFGRDGRLHLQVGSEPFPLSDQSPRIRCTPDIASLGLRKRLIVESSDAGVLFDHPFWAGQGDDFCRWLADRAANPEWRSSSGRRWTAGVEPAVLRAS